MIVRHTSVLPLELKERDPVLEMKYGELEGRERKSADDTSQQR